MINLLLDVLVIVLPMPVLVRLQMSIEKRVGMSLMSAVGLVVTVISVLRLVETMGFNDTTNPTSMFCPRSTAFYRKVYADAVAARYRGLRPRRRLEQGSLNRRRNYVLLYARYSRTVQASVHGCTQSPIIRGIQ
ncbi:uncharacterized protein DSM5745_06833 [Aspergillus mulundensis]|uniref:Rhodopsin domain-containing protein n=1 Tax=Aspergillus mulundensis TaxID=1810919 RepID=A0A3D8RSP8_9EURO|nr:hypothetical protein DSM5745_06833 [Aspergillus mulundensis]RDW76841.1 hypothetical protein DSM5745_06833 [Aspergillus mulundensis]